MLKGGGANCGHLITGGMGHAYGLYDNSLNILLRIRGYLIIPTVYIPAIINHLGKQVSDLICYIVAEVILQRVQHLIAVRIYHLQANMSSPHNHILLMHITSPQSTVCKHSFSACLLLFCIP